MYLKTLDRAFRAIFIFVLLVGMMGVPEARVRAGSALGLGNGLYAEYRDLGGSTVIKTVNGEGPINHGWNGSCPDTNMYQNECGLWAGQFTGWSLLEETLTGYIEAPTTGHYVFHSWIDDYLDITINGMNQVADDIGGAGYSIELDLVEGGFYPVAMNYKNRGGSADVSLFWTLPDSTYQVVPKQYLYTEAPSQSKVGLVTTVDGAGDQSFNWMAYQGLLQAQTDFGIVGTLYEPTSEADYGTLLQQCATDGNSLCFAVGFLMAGAVTAAANANPGVEFALLDYLHDTPPANLRSINFNEKQVGYLAGALAGKMTLSNKIGAVGGMEIPPVTAFIDGYRNGAQCANPDVVVTSEYTGTFTDPALGASTAQAMLANGLDVIYGVAGPTGSGAILYSAQNGGWSIGVDVDEYTTTFGGGSVSGSDKLLTSTMKKLDYAVWKTISDHLDGTFTSGQTTYHLAEGGVGLAPYHETEASILQGTKDYVDGVKAGILDGSIDINGSCRFSAWNVVANGLSGPFHMDFDGAGNLYVANEMGEGVSQIPPGGWPTLFSGGMFGASGLEFNASGILHVSDDTDRIFQLDGAGNQTVFVDSTAGLSNPNAIAFDDQNNLYAVSAGGFVSKFAPDGSLINMYLAEELNTPEGVVADNAAGKIYVSDWDGNVFAIDMTAGGKTLYAQTNAHTDGGLARDADGNIYLSAIDAGIVYRIDALTQAADVCLQGLDHPRGLTFGPDGRLYITEYNNGRVLSAAGCNSEPPPGYEPNPSFGVWFNQNKVDSWGWPYQTDITLTIEDNSTTQSPDYTATLNTGWNPGVSFELGDQFQLQHGQVVTITGGSYTRTHTITDLVVTGINAETNLVTGTAAAGTDVRIENKYDGNIWRHEIAAPDGSWTADFNVPGDEEGENIAEINPGEEFHVGQSDEDGDGTWWYVPIYNPFTVSRYGQNLVQAYDWPAGVQVTLTIDDPNTAESSPDYSATLPTTLNDPNNIFSGTYADFGLGSDYLLKAGDIVTVTGGGVSKTTNAADIHVTSVDKDADIITGTAGPGIDQLTVRLWNLPYEMRREVTPSGGTWTADFSVPQGDYAAYDLTPGDNGVARHQDADGDWTTDYWQILNPFVEASPYSNWVHARGWVLGTLITLEIDDPSNGPGVDYTATDTVHQAPWNPGDPNDILAEFDWPDQFQGGIGSSVTASGDGVSKTLVVSNLKADSFDVTLDTVSGVATPGAQVEVCVNFPDHCAMRRATADASTGEWTADYAHPGSQGDETEIVDLQPGTNGWSADYDADSDRTWYDWKIPNPSFSARLTENEVHGYEWTLGSLVTLTIDDPDNGAGVDYNKTLTVIQADWDPNQTFAQFRLWEDGFTLEPGQLVTMSDGITTKTHTVRNLVVAEANPDTDTVSGTADAGTEVHVGHIFCDPTGCYGFRREIADVNGNWVANFSVPGEDPDEQDIIDLKSGMGNEARIHDEDGDSTQYGWYIPNPYIAIRANFDQVEVYEWPMGSTVTLEIDDPVTPENPDYSTTRLIDEVASWNPSQTYEWFDLNGIIDMQPGFIASMTDGVTTKAHTVTNLAFTEMNIDNDTVTGQALPEGIRVDVWACADNYCVNRHAFSGPGGVWTVDFATPGTQDNEQELMDLVNGTWVDSSQSDDDGDQTMYGQPIPNPRLNAFINGNAIEFYEFGGMDIALNIDDPGTPAPDDYTYSGPAPDNWRLELGESFTLAAGHVITVTGTGVSKTLVVADLSVTGWDLNADTLSGTAPADSDLWVYGYSLGMDASRHFPAPDGAWLADFSTPGDEDFEQTLLNLVNGSSGDARVDDADGDSTTFSWNAYTAWIAPDTVPFAAGMSQYVDLARPSYTLEGWSVLNLLYEPLFRVTQEGTLLPAAALGDAVSPDGLVHTITLRDDMVWSDGQPVTAQNYVDGFLRILAPATTTDYASLLYYDVLGAEAFNNGTETDPNTVGITATGPYTLQFTMVRPAAHFPHVLSVPGFFPVRQDLIDLHGDAWVDPANFAASGPYDLLEYDGTHLLFGKNPLYYAAVSVNFTQIGMPFIPDSNEQFEAYKRGEVDTVLNAPESALGDPAYNAERVFAAMPGAIGIGLNTLRAPTNNPLVRKALAAATDRQALFDQGLLPPWFQKATGMIPPEVPGYQGSGAGYDYNLAQALDFLNQAGYPNGAGLPTIHLYGTPRFTAILEAVANQWIADLGISVEVHTISDQWGYLNDCINTGIENCDYNAFRSGWYMDYFDANNMLGDFIDFHLGARTGWDDVNFRDWLDAARAEQVPTLRLYDLQQAEQWLVNDGVPFIPVYHPKQVNLVKPGIATVFGLVPYFEQWSYHPPITAVDDAYAAVEDTLLTVDAASGLLANDVNSDADPLWVNNISAPISGGTVEVANQEGSFTYQPPANFCGPDSFTYTATDGGGISNSATVSLDVACVNDAPRAYPFTVFVEKNASWPISLVGSDVDSDPLTFTVLSDPAHGVLSGTAPALTYTPTLNYLGSDSFTFEVNDGVLDSLPATITIQVTNVVLPVTPSSFYGEIHILDNPPSAGGYVEAYIPGVSGPVANAVVTNYAGTLIYHIDVPAGAQGSALEGAVVTFKIEDRVVATGIWHSGTQQELNLHPPLALPGGPYASDEGSSISFAALSDDWGADALTYEWDWDNNGTFDAAGQNQSHIWSDDGAYSITLKVTDGQGGVGLAQATVTVHEVPPSNVSAGGPYNGTAGQPVSLGGSATCVPGDGCTFAWDLDNDSFFDDASGLSVSHTWNEAGDYSVSLQVTDDDGNAITSSTIVHITGAVHSLALLKGWNLVSFNVHPGDTGIAAVLASVAGNYDLVYAWDATGAHAGSGNWLRYAPALPPALSTLPTLDERMGFWIHMTSADTLEVVGNVPVTTHIDLSTGAGGWNLVSYPASVNRSLPDAMSLNGVGTDFSLVYSYRAYDVSDPWKLFNRTVPPVYNDLTFLSPGWGYWVKVSANHTWSVNYLP